MGNKIFEYTIKDSYGIEICKMIIRYCEEDNVEFISYENEEESGIYTIDKEDLNDYFVKYNNTVQDLYDLIKNTPEYVIPPEHKMTKVEKFLSNLTENELIELKERLEENKND